MDLAHFSVLFINGTDFARNDEPGLKMDPRGAVFPAKVIFERIEPLPGRNKLFLEFLTPGRMGEIPRPDQVKPFAPRPQFENLGNAFPAGRPGIFRMNMKIGNKHRYTRIFIDLLYYTTKSL